MARVLTEADSLGAEQAEEPEEAQRPAAEPTDPPSGPAAPEPDDPPEGPAVSPERPQPETPAEDASLVESAGDPGAPPPLIVICEQCGHSNVVTSDSYEGIVYQPQPSARYQTCSECGGLGEVHTGSLVKAHAIVRCPECEGRGYRTDEQTPPPPLAATNEPPWPGAIRDETVPGGWRSA